MDDTDRKLVYLMWEDPRMSLREISKRLGISRQTVHRRLQAFERMGVFRNLKAAVAGDYLDECYVAIWGRSDSSSIDSCLERLGESRFTWRVEMLGGNSLFVMASLTETSDLNSYVKFVKSAAEMPEPTIGIMCYNDEINPFDVEKKQSYKGLTSLDLEIIDLLQDNARRPVAEIANAIGVSAKTVRAHLDEMTASGSMIYNQPWDLTSGEDTCTLLYIKLRNGADKAGVAKRLLSMDPTHFNFIRSFSNLPNFLVGLVCCERMCNMRRILRETSEDEEVLTVVPNLVYDERMYWNHDPRSPGVVTHSSAKARKKEMRSRSRAT